VCRKSARADAVSSPMSAAASAHSSGTEILKVKLAALFTMCIVY